MLTKIVGRVVSQDGAVIQSGTVLFQTKKSGIYEQSLRAPGTEIRNILDGMIEDIHLTPGVYTVHVLPDGSLDAPWNFRIALDGTLPEVDLFEQAPIDDIGGYDKTSLIAAIADSVNPVLGGYVEDAQAAQAAAKISETNAGVSATNAGTSAGTATTQADRAKTEADRAQALANDIGAVATMRVDTTVGVRVFISNGVTERMISADTMWRAIQWWDAGGVVQGLPLEVAHGYLPRAGEAGGIYVRRINDMVYMRILAITTTSGAQQFPIPNGFSAGGAPYPAGLLRANSSTPYEYRSGGALVFAGIAKGINTETQYAIEASWVSKSAWPTTLPGIPA